MPPGELAILQFTCSAEGAGFQTKKKQLTIPKHVGPVMKIYLQTQPMANRL